MREYVFVHDRSTSTFPVRRWVDDGSGPPDDAKALQGSVTEADKEAWITRQQKNHPSCEVAAMIATSWQTVENNFSGLHFYDSDYYA